MKKPLIHEFPESVLCQTCIHGELVESPKSFVFLSYICHVQCEVNKITFCPMHEERTYYIDPKNPMNQGGWNWN